MKWSQSPAISGRKSLIATDAGSSSAATAWILTTAILISAQVRKHSRLRRRNVFVPLEQPRLIHIQVHGKQLPLISRRFAVTVNDLAQLAFAEVQLLGDLVLSNAQLKYLQFEIRIHVLSPLTLRLLSPPQYRDDYYRYYRFRPILE